MHTNPRMENLGRTYAVLLLWPRIRATKHSKHMPVSGHPGPRATLIGFACCALLCFACFALLAMLCFASLECFVSLALLCFALHCFNLLGFALLALLCLLCFACFALHCMHCLALICLLCFAYFDSFALLA